MGITYPGDAPTLTDDQIAAGSYYTWDESAYQADTSATAGGHLPLLNNHKEGQDPPFFMSINRKKVLA